MENLFCPILNNHTNSAAKFCLVSKLTTQTLAFSVTGPPPAAVPGCWSPEFSNCLTLALRNSQKVAVFSPIFFLEILKNHHCAYTTCILTLTEEPSVDGYFQHLHQRTVTDRASGLVVYYDQVRELPRF